MKANKNLIIELLSNELVYERKEHKTTLYELKIEQECREVVDAKMERVIKEKEELEKCIAEICSKPSPGELADAGIESRERINCLEELLFEFGDGAQDLEELLFEFGDDIEDREELIFEIGDDLEDLLKENKELKKENTAFKQAIETIKKESEKEKCCDCENDNDGKTEAGGEKKTIEPESEIKNGEKDILIIVKNKLCNKNYKVQQTGKVLIANKPGTRRIEVQHAELPGSVKYIVCSQTYYEFDKAIKASAHGIKYADRISEEDIDGKTEETGGAA